jgi:NADH-quinone oxidoreductase subunit G
MPKITVDGVLMEVEGGKTILQVLHEKGIAVPYYCYHPGLVVDGNCRICLVEVEKNPKLVVACKTPVQDGMVIHTKTEKVQTARRQVLEFLLVNHPIDCPVCDQAGECKLQDYYYDYGLTQSRMKERKVHKPKVVRLGKHVVFDGERCILCSRCVRFTRDISQTGELYIANRGDRSVISLVPGKTLDNPYSLNVVDICPVGALTSEDFRFKKRVWFLEERENVCPGCSRVCSIYVDYSPRENQIYRIRPRKNLWVNQYWICDDGRFTFKRTMENRLLSPILNGGEIPFSSAKEKIVQWIQEGRSLGVVLSSCLTMEELFLLWKISQDTNLFFTLGEDYSFEDGYTAREDDFLIEGDKNPNRKGVEWFFDELLSTEEFLKKVERERSLVWVFSVRYPSFSPEGSPVVVFTSHIPKGGLPYLFYPVPEHFEKEGSYLNVDGYLQVFPRVLCPPPGVEDLISLLSQIGERVGWDLPENRDTIWGEISIRKPPFPSLSFQEGLRKKVMPLLGEKVL